MDQQRQLCEWLLTPGLSYDKIKKLVFEEFNVSTTGGSLSAFYQSYVAAYLLERRALAVGVAKEVGEDLKKRPGEFSQVTIDALEQKAFELANNPIVDSKSIKAVFALLLKARDQELKGKDIEIKLRRLDLLEQNSKSAKEKLDGIKTSPHARGLSVETLKTIEEAAKLL